MNSSEVIRDVKTHFRKAGKNQSIYRRYFLILIAAVLYFILGYIPRGVPFFVFQILFLIEGLAFLQEGRKSRLKFSNYALGVLFICWPLVIALNSSLATGFTVSVSNQIVVCNLICVGILGILTYQSHKKKVLFYHPYLSYLCMAICIFSILIILFSFSMIYLLYLTEALYLEITPFLDQLLRIGAKLLGLFKVYPIVEWLVHGSLLCFILFQSNEKYLKKRGLHPENRKKSLNKQTA